MLSALMDKTQTQGMNTLPSRKPSQLMSVDDFYRSIPWYEHLLGGLTGQDVTLGRGPNDPMRAEIPLSPGDLRAMMMALGKSPVRTNPSLISSKKWYHGTGASDLTPESLNPMSTSSSKNLFGPGIYLTDDSSVVPQGYAKSRAKSVNRQRWSQQMRGEKVGSEVGGTVYEAKVQPRKVLDLEEQAPDEVLEIFKKIDSDLAGGVGYDQLDAMNMKSRTRLALESPDKETTESLYQALKGDMSEMEMLSYEADDVFSEIAESLRREGYDAMTHTGGHRTGGREHQVLIMLDPNDDYMVRNVSSLEERFHPGGEISSFEATKPPKFGRSQWPMFKRDK